MKRFLAILVVLTMCLTLGASALAEKIGVAMPTQSLQRWNQDGAYLKEKLEELGYEVDLQYAENEVATQVSQIENMILGGCKVLVLASIDGSSLGGVLATAKEQGIVSIAYDRLLMQTADVDFYATFDNYKVGNIQGTYVKEALGLADGNGPFNIEFTGGDPADNNAGLFFNGAKDVLQEYLDNGQLVIPSGQDTFEQVATINWKPETAQARMDNLLTANYATGAKLDVALCSNDSTAQGVINALVNFGVEEFPIVTGQDCDLPSVLFMIEGKQSMSVFKDTRVLADQVVTMVEAILKGEEVPVNATYPNGVFDVPSFNCTPLFADVNNFEALLVESGYYTAEQLGL
jgi:putative multiple sugar transport system substrate-binding protein